MIYRYTVGMSDRPDPGIYTGVPFGVYKRWRYVSKSLLGDLLISPAQFVAKVRGEIPWKSSDSMTLGSLVDTLWIERGELTAQWGWDLAPGDLPKTGKKRDAYAAEIAPLQLCAADQAERADLIVAALNGNARAMELRDASTAQVSLVWDCPYTGIRLKGRPDLVDLTGHRLSDLKTMRDVTPRGMASAVSDYNYHWQMHLYAQALAQLGAGDYGDWRQWIIGARNEPIYGVACRPLELAALELARDEVTDLLWRLRACADAQQWPADWLDEDPITLPKWRYYYTPQAR